MELNIWIQPYNVHGHTRYKAGCTVNGERFSCCGRGDTALGALDDLLAHF